MMTNQVEVNNETADNFRKLHPITVTLHLKQGKATLMSYHNIMISQLNQSQQQSFFLFFFFLIPYYDHENTG